MPATDRKSDLLLADEIGQYWADPLGFVLFAYDWNYGDLKGFDGPDDWQSEYLDRLGFEIKKRDFNGIVPVAPMQFATASGHGIGKSALTAWLCNFILSTRPYSKGVVTANTSPQLRTKTWAELRKWTKRSINADWWEITSGQLMKMEHKDNPETWRLDALTCAKENSEAFAGLHAANSTPFYIFDEASAIPDQIWDVAEGGLTDGEPMWFCFGNPTRSTGKFFLCFNRMRHRWQTNKIDSRTAKMTNKAKIQEWIDDFGEDSDFVRIRVRGEFPRIGESQFISADDVNHSKAYTAHNYHQGIKTLAVDVARFGDDRTVLSLKEGRKIHPMKAYRGLDTMRTSDLVAEQIRIEKPAATYIDGGGVGGGVVDRLRQLGYNVIEVNFGAQATDDRKYANKRAEMFGNMREALKAGLDLPDDEDLCDELIAVGYGFNAKQQIQLEKKEDMKRRGLASPDKADALAMHFFTKIGAAVSQPPAQAFQGFNVFD